MDPQTSLEQVYRKKWPQLMRKLAPIAARRRLSRPHLIDLNANGYLQSTVRLMVVGQQTKGWGEGIAWDATPLEAVKQLARWYDDFELGAGYVRSPFWAASYELCRRLNGEGCERQFVWANLVKIDEVEQRPSEDVEDAASASFNVLPAEVRFATPDVVVFFTGPHYDERLNSVFPGCKFEAVKGRDGRVLSLLTHRDLPTQSYRTYHPNYLRRSKNWHVVAEIARLSGYGTRVTDTSNS